MLVNYLLNGVRKTALIYYTQDEIFHNNKTWFKPLKMSLFVALINHNLGLNKIDRNKGSTNTNIIKISR